MADDAAKVDMEPHGLPDAEEAATERVFEEACADADAGRVVAHEDVAEWLRRRRTPRETPMPREWLE